MDRAEIKAGMKVVCKEVHYNDGLYWAIPEMDEAVGKPMTVVMVDRNGLVYCKFETTLKYDDGRWCFLPDWLVLYEEGEEELTDTERERIKAICEVANVQDIGELSDGFHTFNALYEQRMILFAALVKAYKGRAWKSYRHEDGEYCFGGGWFIVGIDTPEGSYTYHYENKYWDMFDCVDLPRGKHWDGHTEADAETRLMSLEIVPAIPLDWIRGYIDRLKAMGVVISIRDAQAVSVMVDKYMMEQNGNAACGPDYCEIGGEHND